MRLLTEVLLKVTATEQGPSEDLFPITNFQRGLYFGLTNFPSPLKLYVRVFFPGKWLHKFPGTTCINLNILPGERRHKCYMLVYSIYRKCLNRQVLINRSRVPITWGWGGRVGELY